MTFAMSKFQLLITIFTTLIILCNGQETQEIDSIKCYHCQSDMNLDCFENVENLENFIIDCTNDCAIGIVNNILYRNCYSSFDNEKNIENFQICNTSLCNNQPIKIITQSDEEEKLPINEISENVENEKIIGDENNLSEITPEEKLPKNEISENVENEKITGDETSLPKNDINPEEEKLLGNEISEKINDEVETVNEKHQKIKCYKCEGPNDKCLIITPGSEAVDCSINGCYTRKSDNILKRGCVTDLTAEENEECTMKKSCNICTEDECNKEQWSKCYSCRSSENPFCAQWQQPENIQIEICNNHNDNCVIEIETEIETVRKCSPENYTCKNNEICTICSGNLCNIGVFPKNRQLCHQCGLTKECGKEQLPENMEICVNYNKNDGCFMFATSDPSSDVLMHRGCKSDIVEYSECQKSEIDKKCITCDNQNGCNSQGARTKPKLLCSICGVDKECAWAQKTTTVKKCTEDYWYTLKEKCFTYLNDNGTAERGCSFDRGVCINEPQRCKTCYKSGCNSGSALFQSCIQCNSSRLDDIQCKKDLKGIVGMKCNKNEIVFDEIGCYTEINGNNVIRGCVSDLDMKNLEKCKDNKVGCFICKEQNCNTNHVLSEGIIIIKLNPVNYILIIGVLIFGQIYK